MSDLADPAVTPPPDISVVVCTYNRAQLLRNTIVSVLNQQIQGKIFEIVVVDDGSTDDTGPTVDALRSGSNVVIEYVKQANSGVGAARNLGIQKASAAWIAFIDDDEIATPQWLAALITTAERCGADCVGGPCLLKPMEPGGDIQPVGTIAMLLGENPAMSRRPESQSWYERLRNRSTRLETPGGGNALVRRSVATQLGGFRLLRFGEDLDFFRRARASGAVIATAHDAEIHHLVPSNRLTEQYLTSLAQCAGRSQAEIDTLEKETLRPYFMALLRLAFSVLVTLPLYLLYFTRHMKSHALSRRCSFFFSMAYVRYILS